MLTIFLAILDTAIANAALPCMAADLLASSARSVWIVNAYQIAAIATLLPFAGLGGVIGARRVYLGGLVVFIVASGLCAASGTLGELTASRVLQGVGASAIMSVNTALIRALYPNARLGSGLGLNALVVGVSFTAGPSIAAAILSLGRWPWLFVINVPFGLIALAAAWRTVPESDRSAAPYDTGAALLNTAAFACLGLALCFLAQGGAIEVSVPALVVFAVTAVLSVRRESGKPAPMLPVDLLARPLFALSTVTSICAFATQGLAFIALPFYFQHTLGLSLVQTGALLTPWSAIVALTAPFAGHLADRFPPAILGAIGLAVLSAGLMSFEYLPGDVSLTGVAIRLGVCGLGFGLFQSPNQKALMSSAPAHRSAGASGVVATARLMGQALGAALVAACLQFSEQGGPQIALALGAVFALAACIASALRMLKTSVH
ncbi:MFS transporter [Pseudomonas tolaasii]